MNSSINLTKGNIIKSIILFSIPLLIGNLFQQLYNTVDSYMVGNYVGTTALAAVGASTPIINMMIGFFMGMSTGAGVVIAQYFGAGDDENMRKAIHNSMALTLVMAIILSAFGLIFSGPLLKAIGVPDNIFNQATSYLMIYFSGITFTLLYNMGAGILRAIGDSRRPLYFLAFSSIFNIFIDYLFVKEMGMGVNGAAWATVLSQGISSILVVMVLLKEEERFRLRINEIRFDREILNKIIKLGLPSGLQQSIVSLSNVVVQSYINVYGAEVIAGYSVTVKIDGFVNLPLQAFNMAITTFVGQNIGAKEYDRVKRGAWITYILATITIGIFVFVMFFWGRNIIALFNQDEAVIETGRLMQLTFLPFYLVLPINQIINGVLRGAGRSAVPMYVMVFSFVILRQIYLFIVTRLTSSLFYIFLAWPVTWIVCSIIFIIYIVKVDWLKEA